MRRRFINLRSSALLVGLAGDPRGASTLSEEQVDELVNRSDGWSLSEIESFVSNLQCSILGTKRCVILLYNVRYLFNSFIGR